MLRQAEDEADSFLYMPTVLLYPVPPEKRESKIKIKTDKNKNRKEKLHRRHQPAHTSGIQSNQSELVVYAFAA